MASVIPYAKVLGWVAVVVFAAAVLFGTGTSYASLQSGPGSVMSPPSPPDSAPSGVKIVFQKGFDWGTGYSANVRITNLTQKEIYGWTLQFNLDQNITSLWEASWMNAGDFFVAWNPSWAPAIKPGQTASLGLVASYKKTTALTQAAQNGPYNCLFNGRACAFLAS